jgi:hypothetical protein
MIRQKLHRPSLRITRLADNERVRSFTFEVWSPFTGNYQVVESIEAAMRRVDQLAKLICQMWLQRHPKQDALMDAPDAEAPDRPGWTRASSLIQATETTCIRVGCALPLSSPA